MARITEKVNYLERMMERIAYNQQSLQMIVEQLSNEMKTFKDEMLAFKNEMKAFKDEMKVFKDEMKMFKDEMLAFKNEMKMFKDEMLDFKEWSKRNIEEIRAEVKEMQRQWGYLANRMETLVEDVFEPSIAETIEKYFGRKPEIVIRNYYQRFDGFGLEIDILALCENENMAFVVEVKASPDKEEYIDRFVEKLNIIKEKLRLIEGYKVYPIYAGLSMKEDTVRKLTKRGTYAMIVKGDILEIVNMNEVKRI